MNYVEKFVEAYVREGLTESEFEDINNYYPVIYGELRRKNPNTLEFWLENPETPDTYKVFEIALNMRNHVTSIHRVLNWLSLPLLLQSAAQKLLKQDSGWLAWYIDR